MVAAAPAESHDGRNGQKTAARGGEHAESDADLAAAQRAAGIANWISQIEADLGDADIELPVLPGVAAEVLSLTGDDAASVGRLAQLIKQDQSLASHVLRIVNSPAYRGAHEIVALQQAITRLGMGRVSEIALAIALSGTAFEPGPYAGLADDAWSLALSTGLWGKEVARVARANVEIAYLCGLLHNVGASLALQRLVANLKDTPAPADSIAAEVLVATTAPAGTILAAHWALPQPVRYVIEHLGDELADEQLDQTLAITQCAVWIARLDAKTGFTESRAEELLAEAAPEFLNLYPDDISNLIETAPQVRAAVEAMS